MGEEEEGEAEADDEAREGEASLRSGRSSAAVRCR